MSNTTSIVCSGYNSQKNEFVFISKDNKNDYYLNVYNNNANQTKSLSSFANFPDAENFTFGGLCAYASSNSSVYLSFDRIPVTSSNASVSANQSTSTTLIYSLQLLNNATQTFQPTALVLFNKKLSSLMYFADVNRNGNLAYVATSNNQTTLNLVNLNNPNKYYTSKTISEAGILATGGLNAQTLYFIQSSTIDVYRLDTQQYSQSMIHTNLNSERLIKATTGQVMLSSNRTVAYISVYNPERGKLDIINHNLALSKFTSLPIGSNGYPIDLNNGNTLIRVKGNTQSISTPSPSSSSVPSTSKSKNIPTSAPSSIDESLVDDDGNNTTVRHKRAVLTDTINTQSSDGAYSYHSAQIVNKDGDPYPMDVVLVPSSNDNQSPPYDFALISSNAQGFMLTTESAIASIGTPLPSPANETASPSQLNGGAIAGIVIGVIAFIAIIAGLLFYAARKRRERKRNDGTSSREITTRSHKNVRTLSTEPEDFLAAYISSPKGKNEDNHSNTSSILQEATSIPEEYHDGSRPDIRPLSYSGDAVDYAHLSPEELLQLEPDINGPLFLFSGLYTSPADERVTYLRDGYAVRAFDAGDGTKHTVHYFSAAHLDTFVRSVFTAIRISKTKGAKQQAAYVIKSERAIVLSTPTPHFSYQYIWITSPVIPEHSLYHLLLEKNRWSFIDYSNKDYKIWSIYAILRSLEALHSHKFVHLAIDLRSFYFDHELKATDWRLGNFEYAHSLKQRGTTRSKRILPSSSSFTAPEIINEQGEITQLNINEEKLDIWSLGCVIYTVATGGLLLFEDEKLVKNLITFNDDMRQHVRIALRDNIDNSIFQTLLEKMLQVHASDRKSIKELLDYWNGIYNMEE